MKTIEYTLPAYWASYLFNGDASGLENKEQEQIDRWVKNHNNIHFTGCSGAWFASHNDANNLGGDVCTYTALI